MKIQCKPPPAFPNQEKTIINTKFYRYTQYCTCSVAIACYNTGVSLLHVLSLPLQGIGSLSCSQYATHVLRLRVFVSN
jgi:hypothetical protein